MSTQAETTATPTAKDEPVRVPFFRPELSQAAIDEVTATLRSGWLTTGPRTQRFEEVFAEAVGARHAIALNSGTAALHLATAALGLRPGQAVLVPTMTFAATAEIVLYSGATPILVDCDPHTLNMDLEDAERKLADLRAGRLGAMTGQELQPVGMLPVHVGGLMLDIAALQTLAARHDLWIVEDAAHAFPAAWRAEAEAPWQRCGEATSRVSCFSFYANKTITTGEGGMAATDDEALAERMRVLALHGLSTDAWGRYTAKGSWDYRILCPGYKYNLTDIAAAIGLHQLERAETMRLERQAIAERFRDDLEDIDALELPPRVADRVHSWHLFQIKLRPGKLRIDRDTFLERLRDRGIGFSVHWRPLHLHPYYADLGWTADQLPTASAVWRRTISLPIFPAMRDEEQRAVLRAVRDICRAHRT